MQRRGISADIVNPSTSERTLNRGCAHDSSISSHRSSSFKPSTLSSLEHIVPIKDLNSSIAGQSRGHVSQSLPPFNQDDCLPHHVQLASIDLTGKQGSGLNPSSNGVELVASGRQTRDMQLTCDKNVSGEPSVDAHASYIRAPSALNHAWTSFSAGSFSHPSSADLGATSLPTAPSSGELLGVETVLAGSTPRLCPLQTLPTLAKESVKQYTYVDSLVDTATVITHALWPIGECHPARQTELDPKILSHFITETLRKSKTSWSTMQLALLYCIRFRRDQLALAKALIERSLSHSQPLETARACFGSMCARRNFLSALILASKYLQDRNFSNKAWSKISGVPITEINSREREFLEITQWRLDIKHDTFKHWSSTMDNFITEIRDNTIFGGLDNCQHKWRLVLHSMIQTDDREMSDFMSHLAIYGPSVVSTQLSTPVSTPNADFESFYEPSISEEESDVCHSLQEEEDLHLCPFFDEFIQTSPRQVSTDSAAAYATPESVVENDLPMHAQMFFDDASAASGPEDDCQGSLLTPESVTCDTEDGLTTARMCTKSVGRKRSHAEAQLMDADAHDATELSVGDAKRTKQVTGAFSRVQ